MLTVRFFFFFNSKKCKLTYDAIKQTSDHLGRREACVTQAHKEISENDGNSYPDWDHVFTGLHGRQNALNHKLIVCALDYLYYI